jgi:hypothetical protein
MLYVFRALLREVVCALRHDLPLPTFCAALLHACMQERRKVAIREFEFKVWQHLKRNMLVARRNNIMIFDTRIGF